MKPNNMGNNNSKGSRSSSSSSSLHRALWLFLSLVVVALITRQYDSYGLYYSDDSSSSSIYPHKQTTVEDDDDHHVQQQQEQEQKQQEQEQQQQHPIIRAMLDFTMEVSSTGYRHVRELQRCHIFKVASSVSRRMHTEFDKLLKHDDNHNNTPTTTSNYLLADSFQFVIIRDPLSRLYSGYSNKCLHQIPSEFKQCPNFPNARQHPPTFQEWLIKVNQNKGLAFYNNGHFKSMSNFCNMSNYDVVLSLEDPFINQKLSKLWKALGVPHNIVDEEYPVVASTQNKSRDDNEQYGGPNGKRNKKYYSNASNNTSQYYNCETLSLALPLLEGDYEGPYKEWFPLPQWAIDMKQQCSS